MRKEIWAAQLVIAACGSEVKVRSTTVPATPLIEAVAVVPDSTSYVRAVAVSGTKLVFKLEVHEMCTRRDRAPLPCNERPVVEPEIQIMVGGEGWSALGSSDATGTVAVDMLSLPETAFASPKLAVTLHFRDVWLPVDLAASHATHLRATLENSADSRISIDRAAITHAHELVVADANGAIQRAQAFLDAARIDDAVAELNDHQASLAQLEGVQLDQVVECLTAAKDLRRIEGCVAQKERTQEELQSKRNCLRAFAEARDVCGPLNVTKMREALTARFHPDTAQARIESAQRKLDDEQNAHARLCLGHNVTSVLVALRTGRDLRAAQMTSCRYSVPIGVVDTTTNDGWTIVAWGSMRAAFRTTRPRVNGAVFRTTGEATYRGLVRFERVDGSGEMIATFKLSE